MEPSSNNIKINTLGSIPDTGVKVPARGTLEAGRLTSAEQNATKEAAFVAVEQINKSFPPTLVTTLDAITEVDSHGVSKARDQVGTLALIQKKQVILSLFLKIPPRVRQGH